MPQLIPLNRGLFALVDDEDADLMAFKWRVEDGSSWRRRTLYAVSTKTRAETGGRQGIAELFGEFAVLNFPGLPGTVAAESDVDK